MVKIELLILQNTPFCNINCKYCYLPNRSDTSKISKAIVESVFIKALEEDLIDSNTGVLWHAGEPLTFPPKQFETLLDTIASIVPDNIQFTHHIQTNGILLSPEWIRIIQKFSIRIGISLDGPEFLNDFNRVDRKNKSTFHKTMEGIRLLKEANIPFHIISVVSSETLDYPNELYEFFLQLGAIRLALNVEEMEGIHSTSSIRLNKESMDEKVTTFYQRIYELQHIYKDVLPVREFEFAKKKIIRQPLNFYFDELTFSQLNHPLKIVTVDKNGNLSTFSPELIGHHNTQYNNFIFGNILRNSFSDILRNEQFKRLESEINSGILNCKQNCDYFSVCGGGSPSNKYFENGSFASSETNYCKVTVQKPIDILVKSLEKTLGLS